MIKQSYKEKNIENDKDRENIKKQENNCLYSNSSFVKLQPPLSPISPIVSLKSSDIISSCANIILDVTQSTGNAIGKNWKSMIWSVTGDNIEYGYSNPVLEVIMNYKDTTKLITIPNHLLLPGRYDISLELTNFFDKSDKNSISINFQDSSIQLPSVYIITSKIKNRLRSQPLSLFAKILFPQCYNQKNIYQINEYKWKVFDESNGNYIPTLVSKSKDKRYFKLNGDELNSSSTYLFQVIAILTANNTSINRKEVHSSLSIDIGIGYIVPIIKGGLYKTISNNIIDNEVIIDASSSYDIDEDIKLRGSEKSLLKYSWMCIQTIPYSNIPCLNELNLKKSTIALQSMRNIYITTTYKLVLYIENLQGNIVNETVILKIIPANDGPLLSIINKKFKFNNNEKINLIGTIKNNNYTNLYKWSLLSFENSEAINQRSLSSIALSPTYKMVNSNQLTSNTLVISPYSMESGIKYTFVLALFNSSIDFNTNINSNSYSMFNTKIDIEINKPPIGGQVRSFI
jgi:hypothetical protein